MAREVEGTGVRPASHVFADQTRIKEWDALAGGGFDAIVEDLKDRSDLTIDAKLRHLREEVFPRVGYRPSYVGGDLDRKNLRFYEWQTGELYIHAAALMVDEGCTVEVAYEPHRHFTQFLGTPRDPFTRYDGPPLPGTSLPELDRALIWRRLRGQPVDRISMSDLADTLIDMQARPLRSSLSMRDVLMREYGIAPHRIRLAYDDQPREVHYAATKFRRAQLVALTRVRDTPVEARRAMITAMRGTGERGKRREARARSILNAVWARHEPDGRPRPYALLWMRDTRLPVGAFMDTKPELLRQSILELRASHPDRQLLIIGDDLLNGWPALRDQLDVEGVLRGVDTDTLVRFWTADKNGGTALGYGEQALALHYLNTERDIVQLGMESGAIEIPITLGVPTVYFQTLEHTHDKGYRWQLYWDQWKYTGPTCFEPGASPRPYRGSGQPTELPAPLRTIQRVEFGPDLPDPDLPDPGMHPVTVHYPATVLLAADRLRQVLDNNEMATWSARLGRHRDDHGGAHAWTADDWAISAYYAGQLQHWLTASPATIGEAATRWEAIHEAAAGVITAADPHTIDGYRHRGLHAETPSGSGPLTQAYRLPLSDRPAAVITALWQVLDEADLQRQAVNDLRLLRLSPQEQTRIRTALAAVTAARPATAGTEPATAAPRPRSGAAQSFPRPPQPGRQAGPGTTTPTHPEQDRRNNRPRPTP